MSLFHRRVHSVGYRMSTMEVANDLLVSSWVRNLSDGRVEAVFEGTRDVVEEIIAWCRRGKPPSSKMYTLSMKRQKVDGGLRLGVEGAKRTSFLQSFTRLLSSYLSIFSDL